jgi:hypothetical protein
MKRLVPYALAALLAASGCASRSGYEVPVAGHFFVVQVPGGRKLYTAVDYHIVEGYEEVFRRAGPLAVGLPPEARADFEFVEIVDGRVVKTFALFRRGEVFSDGHWSRVDAAWHYRWRIMYDPTHAAESLEKGEPEARANPGAPSRTRSS